METSTLEKVLRRATYTQKRFNVHALPNQKEQEKEKRMITAVSPAPGSLSSSGISGS